MFCFFKTKWSYAQAVVLFYSLIILPANANEILDLDVYRIQPSLLNDFDVIKKDTSLNVILQNNIYSDGSKNNDKVFFKIADENKSSLNITGSVSKISRSGRVFQQGVLELSTDKLYLDDGREISISASSPHFQAAHPPHVSSNLGGVARAVTSLSSVSGPATLGIGYGAGFIANGLLSAYQNGIGDFVWGGFDGIGLSFIERIFRKQPELSLGAGSSFPLVLNDDLKISKGIHKEKIEMELINEEEALKKIEKLLQWGDLTGALELSIKTGQKEKYEEIMRKISS